MRSVSIKPSMRQGETILFLIGQNFSSQAKPEFPLSMAQPEKNRQNAEQLFLSPMPEFYRTFRARAFLSIFMASFV